MLLLLASTSLAPPARAQQPAQVNFSIAEQPLDKALLDLARQANIAISAPDELTRGKRAPSVQGVRAPADALRALLAGSGLDFEFTSADTVRVRARQESTLRVQPPLAPVRKRDEPPPEELTVTGSRLVGVGQGAVELRAYSSEKIELSGQPSLLTFLATLPEVSVTQPFNAAANYGATATIQLRGLPVGTTLVLIDGQRLDTSALAGSSFDINQIPSALVDRVEIVPVGSSAIYGSDAIAGVVNIITKRKPHGLDVETTYSDGDHFRDRRSNAAGGYGWDTGSVSFGLSYQRRSGLQAQYRDLLSNIDFRRFAAYGGRDARSTACFPGTISSTNGAALPGLNASTATIPAGTVAPTIAAFVPTAGQSNLCSRLLTVQNPLMQYGGLISGEQQVGESTAFGSVLYNRSRNRSDTFGVPLSSRLVPASNAYNPFGQPILVSTYVPVPYSYSQASNFVKTSVGLKGSFRGWNYRAYASYIQDDASTADRVTPNETAIAAALASSSPATALNPFNPGLSPQSVLDQVVLNRRFIYQASTTLGGGYVQGPLVALPWGDLQLVTGGELQRDTFLRNASTIAQASRRSKAAFGELSLPVFKDTIAGALTLNAALRYNDYSDFGQRYVPQYSAAWIVTDELSLRASHGRSFRAPPLYQLFQGQSVTSGPLGSLVDPRNPGASYSFTTIGGGNVDLKPELGRSYAFGATWKRSEWLGLQVSGTYFRAQQSNRIVSPGSFTQALINDPTLLPGRVVRDATGRIASIDLRFANFGAVDVSGVDVDVSLRIPTSIGEFSPTLSISQLTKYKAAITPTSGIVDRLAKATNSDVWAPRTRGTLGLQWSHEAYRANLAARYVGHYQDYPSIVNGLSRQIGGYTFLDGSFEVDMTELTRRTGMPGKSYVRFSGSNLLDKKLTYSNYLSGSVGYDPLQDDPVGRLLGVTVGLRF